MLTRIAYYDLDNKDPLAISAVRQWANEAIEMIPSDEKEKAN